MLKLPDGAEDLKGKRYCQWYNSWTYSTNQCTIFRDRIQDLIKRGKLKFPEKPMGVDEDPFPAVQEVSINMNLVAVEAFIEGSKKEHQAENANRLKALAKKSLYSQDFNLEFYQNLYIGCGKKY